MRKKKKERKNVPSKTKKLSKQKKESKIIFSKDTLQRL